MESSGSSDFVADLGRQVRRNIGLPEDVTEPPPEPEPKGRRAKREWRRLKKLNKQAPPTPNQIAASLVKRNDSRLSSVTAKHEKVLFDLEPPTRSQLLATVKGKDEYGKG